MPQFQNTEFGYFGRVWQKEKQDQANNQPRQKEETNGQVMTNI